MTAPDAKDLDDAISVHKTIDGYTLGVHIADVSHYVKAGSALDKEAFRRGTSVYFADRVIPMLPEALSNGVCSLNAGTEKLTFSCLMDFDKDGHMTDYRFEKAVIVSKVRGVYKEVNQIFAGTASPDLVEKYSPVAESLQGARELADILKANGRARGQMDLTSDETKFVLDENGVCVDVVPPHLRGVGGDDRAADDRRQLRRGPRAALQAEIPFLYRVHEKPQPDRVVELYELLDRLGIPCREIKRGNPSTKDFAAVLDRVKDGPRGPLVNQRILRTMEKARYYHRELGHFGLALGEYSHFTSPIRLVPGHLHPPHFKRPGGRRRQAGIDQALQDLRPGERRGVLEKRGAGGLRGAGGRGLLYGRIYAGPPGGTPRRRDQRG